MSTEFYRPFDRECLRDEWNRARTPDYRSIFHQDRDRVMFTSAFRRLQAKTQVFQAGEYDFYRTRLTHSLEVANIAKSIAAWLRVGHPEVQIDGDLLEAICLAHDIGHPPFGHAGERVLNRLMANYGGFEGNAQTLRILTRTIYREAGRRAGMSPSRALLDGVLKYKRPYAERGGEPNHFIYDDQAPLLAFCFGTTDLLAAGVKEANRFRSLECQVMDLADDIAYSCFDLVDGAKARFVTGPSLAAWREAQVEPEALGPTYPLELTRMVQEGRIEPRMNRVIGELIQGSHLVAQETFLSGQTARHAYRLGLSDSAAARIAWHKAIARDLVFGSSALHQIEAKGGWILERLSAAYFENYGIAATSPGESARQRSLTLVPAAVHRAVTQADSPAAKARLLCDHVAGMTDAYALRSYKRLFDPDYGSISELL